MRLPGVGAGRLESHGASDVQANFGSRTDVHQMCLALVVVHGRPLYVELAAQHGSLAWHGGQPLLLQLLYFGVRRLRRLHRKIVVRELRWLGRAMLDVLHHDGLTRIAAARHS